MTRRAALAVVAVFALVGCAESTPLVDPVEQVAVSDDARTLTVTVTHGACEEGTRRVTAQESATEVRLRVSGARALPGDCVAIGVVTRLNVTLADPLDDRRLVDDSNGEVLDVED